MSKETDVITEGLIEDFKLLKKMYVQAEEAEAKKDDVLTKIQEYGGVSRLEVLDLYYEWLNS